MQIFEDRIKNLNGSLPAIFIYTKIEVLRRLFFVT